jgi:hypothetical protein
MACATRAGGRTRAIAPPRLALVFRKTKSLPASALTYAASRDSHGGSFSSRMRRQSWESRLVMNRRNDKLVNARYGAVGHGRQQTDRALPLRSQRQMAAMVDGNEQRPGVALGYGVDDDQDAPSAIWVAKAVAATRMIARQQLALQRATALVGLTGPCATRVTKLVFRLAVQACAF